MALDPESAEAYKALGYAEEALGRDADGLKSYLKAVELNPNFAPAINEIASAKMEAGRIDEAVIWIRKAIRLQPGSARYYALAALLYYDLGLDDSARQWFERALEFDPDYVFPQFILAYLDLYAGRSGAAWSRMEKLLKARPTDAEVLEEAGDVKLLSGAWQEAADLYAKVGSATRRGNATCNKLGLALLKLGRKSEADKLLEDNLAALLKSPRIDIKGSAVPYEIASIQTMLIRPKDALDWLAKSVELGHVDRWIAVDPAWEGLRTEPRYLEITARYQNGIEAMRKRVREAGLDQ